MIGHIRTLDGWRAAAVLLVLLDHGADPLLRLCGLEGTLGARHIKEGLGRAGVHLFFSLSGYLITARMIDEAHRQGTVSLKEFYLRRIFRIQPAAVFFLLCAGALGLAGVIDVSSVGWWSALLGFANLTSESQTWYTGHFWSLAVEEHFYLLWPAAFVLLGKRRLRGAICLALLVALWRFVVIKSQFTFSSNFSVRTDIESEWLLWGCVAALAERSQRRAGIMHTLSARWVSLAAVPLVVLSSVLQVDWKVAQLIVSLTALTVPLLFIGTVRRPDSPLGRLLELPAVAWLGRISFSLYLWQQLFFVWDAQRAPAMGWLQSFPVNVVAAVLCATASFYLIERPVIAIGRRFIADRRVVKKVRPVG